MKSRFGITLLVCTFVVLTPLRGRPVIIASGDGTGNTSAPSPDPGFANVGSLTTGLTVIYVGNGWVLTANHVGSGNVVLAGQTYPLVAGSELRLVNQDSSQADLLMFQISGSPPLSTLLIAGGAPTAGLVATMIGNGLNRGAPISWMGIGGFQWGSGSSIRWGTAGISQVGVQISTAGGVTQTFQTLFENGGTPYPAQAAVGDSGGAVFLQEQGALVLAGVMIAIDEFNGQPASTALFGNHTYAADLSYYRSQIVSLNTPVPKGCGLGAELAFLMPTLLWLRGRRHGQGAFDNA